MHELISCVFTRPHINLHCVSLGFPQRHRGHVCFSLPLKRQSVCNQTTDLNHPILLFKCIIYVQIPQCTNTVTGKKACSEDTDTVIVMTCYTLTKKTIIFFMILQVCKNQENTEEHVAIKKFSTSRKIQIIRKVDLLSVLMFSCRPELLDQTWS